MGASWSRSHRQLPRHGRQRYTGEWRMLHGLARLLVVLQQFQRSRAQPRRSLALRERRLHQRHRLLQQLAEANPGFQQLTSPAKGWWLWQGLRWGGPAVLIGWWLAQAATG